MEQETGLEIVHRHVLEQGRRELMNAVNDVLCSYDIRLNDVLDAHRQCIPFENANLLRKLKSKYDAVRRFEQKGG